MFFYAKRSHQTRMMSLETKLDASGKKILKKRLNDVCSIGKFVGKLGRPLLQPLGVYNLSVHATAKSLSVREKVWLPGTLAD